jgi:hypothetical protein
VNADDDDPRALVVAHHHPGWLRVRARRFEEDDAARDAVSRALHSVEGVARVASSSDTGSLLVEYDADQTDVRVILSALCESTGLVLRDPSPVRMGAAALFDAARAVDAYVYERTGGRVDIRVAIPAAMGFGSLASLVWSGHRRAPRWDNLLYWCFTLFRELNEAAARDGERGSDPAH